MDDLVSFSLDTNDFSSLSERDGNDSCIFKIAGITKYLKIEDAFSFGIAVGYIQVEEDNPYDSDALGIYTKNNQLIGYVSKKEQILFKTFTKKKKIPALLIVTPFWDKEGEACLKGKACALRIYKEYMDESQKLIQKVVDDFTMDLHIAFTQFSEKKDSLKKKESDIKFLQEMVEDSRIQELHEAIEIEKTLGFMPSSFAFFCTKQPTLHDEVLMLEVKNVNTWLNILFFEDFGIAKGYTEGVEIHKINTDGYDEVIGNINDEDKETFSQFTEGHKCFCFIGFYPSLNKDDEYQISCKILLCRFYPYDDKYNNIIVGKYGSDFYSHILEELKSWQLQIEVAKENNNGELKLNNEYYNDKYTKGTLKGDRSKRGSGCCMVLFTLIIFMLSVYTIL
jgi:hypothetical protein